MNDEQLTNLFLSEEFNAPAYVTDFLRYVRPGEEAKKLQALRNLLTAKSNVTADQIKDIVFDHYRQFIETSKEITNLERDIYELSTLLTEQKNLIENMMEMSGLEKRSSCSTSISTSSGLHNQQSQQLQVLMKKLDGVAPVLNSMSECEHILFQGQLMLLDSDTMQPKHPIYLALLRNSLFLGHPTTGHISPKHPFHLVSNYQLDSIALVNVKRVPAAASRANLAEHNLVQLLVFPEQPYLRAENARIKREWLDSVEEAKRKQQEERALVRQATIRARRRNILSSIVSRTSSTSSATEQKKAASLIHQTNEEHDEELENDEQQEKNDKDSQLNKHAEDKTWLNELVSELQDVISHRHMEEAVEMLLEWKSCHNNDPLINAKFAAIEKQVVQLLTDDAKRPEALHGCSRELTQPIQQLITLGRTSYAIELYLRRRSALLRASSRELTITEEPLSYVRQISGLFVNNIIEVCTELLPYRKQLCLVLAWSSRELSTLLSLIKRHVIEVAPTMAVLTNSWRILIGKCSQLTAIGLDLSFEVNRLAAPSLRNALKTNFDNILESIRLRNLEERWIPFSLETDQNLIRFLEEMSDIKLKLEWAICRPESPPPSSNLQYRFALNVSQSGCMFARTALQLSRDLVILNTSPHLQQLSDMFIYDIWFEELSHLTKGMHPSIVHHCTSRFIISQVLPLCEKIYQGGDGADGLLNNLLMNKFSHLVHFQRKPSNIFDEDAKSDEGEEVANV